MYADTSVFVSFYITDRHSEQVRNGVAQRPLLWFTPLHRAEWTHAIELHLFRKFLSAKDLEQIYANFTVDIRSGLWVQAALPERVFDVAVKLARAHAARIGVRTLDTLHVASALEMGARRFWTFDERQAKLAKAAGLKAS